MHVLLDTNIVCPDPMMQGRSFQMLFDYLRRTGSFLILPDVVRDELTSHFREQCVRLKREYGGVRAKLRSFGLAETPALSLDIDSEEKRYIDRLTSRIADDGAMICRADTITEDYEAAYKRLIAKRKPCKVKGDAGYKDTLIWLSLLSFGQGKPNEVAFVTSNWKDFSEGKEEKLKLHRDLVAESQSIGMTVVLYRKLDDFLKEGHPAEIEFINNEWIVGQLGEDFYHELTETACAESRFFDEVLDCVVGSPLAGEMSWIPINGGYGWHLRDFSVYEYMNKDITVTAEFEFSHTFGEILKDAKTMLHTSLEYEVANYKPSTVAYLEVDRKCKTVVDWSVYTPDY